MDKRRILILGGARSGKSRFAQEMALRLGERVLFVATAEALDEEMRQRIEEHKKAGSSSWRTIEAPFGVGRRIREQSSDAHVLVLDCLTLLVSNVIGQCSGDPARIDTKLLEHSGRLDRDPGHHHILQGFLIGVDGDGGDCPDNVQSLDDLSKDGAVAVQIVLSAVADIELG